MNNISSQLSQTIKPSISKLNTPIMFITFLVIIGIIMSALIALLFVPSYKFDDINGIFYGKSTNIFIWMSIAFSIIGIIMIVLPAYKEFWKVVSNMKYVLFLLGWIMLYIMLNRYFSYSAMNYYSLIGLPIFLIGSMVFFKKALSAVDLTSYNMMRLVYSILFYLLLTIFSILLILNPGNYIYDNFFVIIILFSYAILFGFSYLTTLLRLPYQNILSMPKPTSIFSPFIITLFSIAIFLGIILYGIISKRNKLFTYNKDNLSVILKNNVSGLLFLLLFVFGALLLFFTMVSYSSDNESPLTADAIKKLKFVYSTGKNIGLLLLMSAFVGLIVYYAIKGTTFSIVKNISILLMILSIIIIILRNKSSIDLTNTMSTISTISKSDVIVSLKNTPVYQYKILMAMITIVLVYFLYNIRIFSSEANLLVNEPIALNQPKTITDYMTLNGIDKKEEADVPYNYRYALSFWVYLNSAQTSMSVDSLILDYGGSPSITYNTKTNTLHVNVNDTQVFEYQDMPLQKWVNVVVNFDGSSMDVFINAKLIQSVIIIPNIQFGNLRICGGSLNGHICNINYYNSPITLHQITSSYNAVKYNTPPISNYLESINIKHKAKQYKTEPTKSVNNIKTIPINIDIKTKFKEDEKLEPLIKTENERVNPIETVSSLSPDWYSNQRLSLT